MNAVNTGSLIVKESDYRKLMALIEQTNTDASGKLEDELSRAEIVEDSRYPKDAVCIGSRVGFTDVATGKENEVTVVCPADVDLKAMKISVLTPMGSALIGMRMGSAIDWELPGGKRAKIKVLTVNQ